MGRQRRWGFAGCPQGASPNSLRHLACGGPSAVWPQKLDFHQAWPPLRGEFILSHRMGLKCEVRMAVRQLTETVQKSGHPQCVCLLAVPCLESLNAK